MWSRISSALKPRDGNDGDTDHADAQSPPDPFRANATTYYTHHTPPTSPPRTHSRTASREEDIIWSLRTQLALQQEMCAQFEIDLAARDELVEVLTTRLEASEKDNDKRKGVIRSWKKKAADLEKMCRHLEHEVDNSRQESMERSIMDEASGEALRQLHRQITQLEREKKDIEVERNALAQTVGDVEAEVSRLREKLDVDEAGGEVVSQLRHRISELEREKDDVEGERNALVQAVGKADEEISKLRGELSVTDEASVEALRQLHSQISFIEQEKNDLQAECDALVLAREKSDAENLRLREELDTAEQAERTNSEALCRLRDQISLLEHEKSSIDAERNSLMQAKERADADVVLLKEELDTSDKANREALRRLHDQVSQLEQAKADVETERDDFSAENVRLRTHIHQLQKDSAALEVTIVQLNKQVDQDKEDIDGLNIALESKQQELELVKRKHGGKGAVGSTTGRTKSVPSVPGKSAGNAVPPSTVSRTSAVGALGRAANTRPPVSSGLRRASSANVELKTKPPSRRLSITSTPSEADEKENATVPAPQRHARRTMVPA